MEGGAVTAVEFEGSGGVSGFSVIAWIGALLNFVKFELLGGLREV